ncbi:DNA damage response protein RcaA [Aspergillus saccharolyticus JOP 1030-1]|uniref:DNA damage response protein RcaA n=1 Tax=Aspergillus saccharolyticus JOP 1030-1 TaxID=1450539 RepID=A0A318Z8R0_9EURO|nr:DNA damage response protein RcaA [Aspergillus saccharolyticus JOP 1030-1]PYH43646.1 DNA damage response protein RcaA [Aspergillus saccharolyticus JOP 1030-1]
MWILESEGDFLEGKRVWLRPGNKYLFGRAREDGVRHAIANKTISRKHLLIDVSPVKPGDGSHIHAKSEITVTDLGSKLGTKVDGERIDGSLKLKGEDHELQLGRYEHMLCIKWHPIVLSFSFSSKELRARDPLARVRSRLEDLDIKTIIPYVVDQTTHVVQSKRNTAKGLQALVNAKHIVQDTYVDALVYAATPSDLDSPGSLCPLEADFDSAWPDPAEHLPPPGKETTQRPKEAFAPNPARLSIFEGFIFVFGDATQMENLADALTNGQGKVLLYQIEDGVTTAEEFAEFMRDAAGIKGLGSQRDSPGGVVHVRYRAKGRHEEWSLELSKQIALLTGQRVIEQSEFLDAILGNDAAPLCQPLLEEADSSDHANAEPTPQPPQGTPSSETVAIADSQPLEEASQPLARKSKPRVRGFVSKMKTFDDGFDINSIPMHAPPGNSAMSPPPMEIEPASAQESQAQSLNEEEDVVSSLLPGSAAMKRRRAETVRQSVDKEATQPKEESPRKPKRQKLDVLEAARQHREAEEDAERQRRVAEEASLQNSLQEVDIEKLKGLAIVEEMDIKPRNVDTEETRWDDRWNGRKNFKKFRRKGDPSQPRYRIQTVIVPLEEVTRKDFGVGDHYWVGDSHRSTEAVVADSPSEPAITQSGTVASRSQSLARTDSEAAAPRTQKRLREEREDSDSDDELRFRFRRRR